MILNSLLKLLPGLTFPLLQPVTIVVVTIKSFLEVVLSLLLLDL